MATSTKTPHVLHLGPRAALMIVLVLCAALAGPGAGPAHAAETASVTIRVTTTSGVPAPGLTVQLGGGSAITASTGEATFSGALSGVQTLRLSAPLVSWEGREDDEDTGGDVWSESSTITLSAGANGVRVVRPASLSLVRGTVTDHGAPVSGAVTYLWNGPEWEDSAQRTTTDTLGRYSFVVSTYQVSSTPFRVSVNREAGLVSYQSYAPDTFRGSDATTFTVAKGTARTLDVALQALPQGSITGRIVGFSGECSCEVWAMPLDDGALAGGVLAAGDGSFTISHLVAGAYRVQIRGEDLSERYLARVTVADGAQTKVGDVAVDRRGWGKVTVKVSHKASTRGAVRSSVTLLDAEGKVYDWESFRLAAGARSKKVSITGVGPGTYRVLLAGQSAKAKKITVAVGKTTKVGSFKLRPTTKISGTALAPGGTPLKKVTVCVDDSRGLTVGCQETGAAGKYSIAGVAAGTYQVYGSRFPKVKVGTKKRFVAQRGPVAVKVRSTTARTGVKVRLEKTGNVSGRVLGVDGRPVRGLWVVATTAAPVGSARSTLTAAVGADGRYTLPGLAAGVRYRVAAIDYESGVYATAYVGGATLKKASKVVVKKPGATKKLSLITVKKAW